MILLYMSTSLYQANGVSDEMEVKLQKAVEQLEELKIQNRKLHSLAEELKWVDVALMILDDKKFLYTFRAAEYKMVH